ncbi:MAG: hypothetical protein ACYC46_04045 [Acidobacteriaceae bacterium]
MFDRIRTRGVILLGAIVLAAGFAGCNVQSNSSKGKDNVKIETPFGGMQVKTDDAAVVADIGLPVYPGATVVKKDGKDNGAADVNMSFGSFHLRVKAVSYHSADPQDKILAFYKKSLGRYGDVIECRNHQSVGTPTKTSEGLTCADTGNSKVDTGDGSNAAEIQLKAGSSEHQHIVSIEQKSDGTKFGLIALDLPRQDRETN